MIPNPSKAICAFSILLICLLALNAEAQTPNISSISPLNGPVGTQVTISGSDFDPIASNNLVYFGAVQAVVTGATSTELTVMVPSGTTYQPITVITNGLVEVSDFYFVVTFDGSRFFDENSFDASLDFATGSKFLGNNPTSLIIGDFDQDGNPDIATINNGDNTVSVLRNITSGNSIEFEAKLDFDVGPDPNSLAVGDLDGDGKLDIVVTNDYSNNTVNVLRNTSSGTGNISFAAKATYTVPSFPRSVALADFDGDGLLDMVIGSSNFQGYTILENLSSPGTISFDPKPDFSSVHYIGTIGIGDFDNDGKIDFAGATFSTNQVVVFKNTSTGIDNFSFTQSFLSVGNFTGYSAYKNLQVGDLDSDSKLDLVLSTPGDNSISVIRNTSDGGISFADEINYSTGTLPYSLLISDLNGDAKPDIATSNRNGNTLSIFKNISSAPETIEFQEGFELDLGYTTNPYPWYLAAADMNTDEKPDLVLSVNREDIVSVFRNINTERTGTALLAFSVEGETGSAVIDAINSKVDVEVTFGTDITSLIPEFTLSTGASASVGAVLQESGSSTVDFTSPVIYEVIAEDGVSIENWEITISLAPPSTETDILSFELIAQTGLTVIDNVNHTVELEISRFVSIEELVASFTLSKGAIASISGVPQISGMSINNFSSSLTYSILAEDEFTTQDWVITILYDQSTKIISFEPKSGQVGTTLTITAENFTFDATPANNKVYMGGVEAEIVSAGTDLLSVVVPPGSYFAPLTVVSNGLQASSLEPFRYSFISATQGLDASSFQTSGTILPAGLYAIDVAAGDLNQDGKSDIVVANNDNSTISLYKNSSQETGQIAFADKMDMSIGNSPTSVAISDINLDGKLDVVVTAGSIYILINNSTAGGDISFLAPLAYDGGADVRSIRIGDIDRDGLPDLICAASGGASFSVLRNTSSGSVSFAAKVSFASGTRPWGLDLGDIDGDGKIDVSVVDDIEDKVSVFKNLSTPGVISFGDKIDFTTGPFPVSVDVVDLDGDLRNDLVVGLFDDSNAISILKNIRTETGKIQLSHSLTATPQSGRGGVKPGNLDGDDDPDIATTARAIENMSSGVDDFSLGTPVSHGGNHFSIAISDFDNDGKADIVGTNYTQSSITIHRNLIRTPSSEAELLDFSIEQQTSSAVINTNDNTINIEVPFATDLTNLVASFNISLFATITVNSVTQQSGVTSNDFSNPVTYEISSENGNVTELWVVTVTKAAPSTETEILSFSIPQQTTAATISNNSNSVDLEVPFGTDVSALIASFDLSLGAAASVNGATQSSGTTPNDFTSPVTYTITAQDGVTTRDWLVTVEFALNTESDIVSFSIPEETSNAIINDTDHTIQVEVEADADITSLTPTIELSFGATVSPLSGTQQDFTNAVTYTVLAEDGITSQDWQVMLSVVLGIEEDMNMNISLYPNPVKDELNINLGEMATQPILISVYSSMGKQILSQQISDSVLLHVDVKNLHQGIYTIRIQSGTKYTIQRFMKD